MFTPEFENETPGSLNSPKYNSTGAEVEGEKRRRTERGRKRKRKGKREENPLNKKIYQICIENLTFLPCIMNLYSWSTLVILTTFNF